MKKLFLMTILFLSVFASVGTDLFAQEKLSKKERKAKEEQALAKALEERNYQVDISMMSSSLGVKQITDNYSLTIKGETLVSYLPYMGRAENVPYGGGKGLNFEAKINKYETSKTKKGTRILIDVENDEDNYHFNLEVFPNGACSLSVLSRNRESINYSGDAHPIEE